MAGVTGSRTLSALKCFGSLGAASAASAVFYQGVIHRSVDNSITASIPSSAEVSSSSSSSLSTSTLKQGQGLQQPCSEYASLPYFEIDVDNDSKSNSPSEDVVVNNEMIEIEEPSFIRSQWTNFISNPSISSVLLQEDLSKEIFSEEKINLLCDVVSQCLEDDNIMNAIRSKIRHLPALSNTPLTASTPAQLVIQNLSHDWIELIGSHKCCMCLDLLAAPCVTSCGHSFCGECITNHINRCTPIGNDDIEVTLTCPMCRNEITGKPTFERVLDEDIGNKVMTFPDCVEKRDWSFRREKFKTQLILNNEKKKVSSYSNDDDGLDADETVLAIAVAVVIFIVCYKYILSPSSLSK